MVFGCRRVPCRIMFESMNPKPGKKISIPAYGFKLMSIIGTIAKFII